MIGPESAEVLKIGPAKLAHIWSADSLFNKAQRYFEEMREYSNDEWQFGLWSTLGLELLARAALAKVSMTLLAEPKDWNNLYFSLGHTPRAQKFIPKSVDVREVFARLRDINPKFTSELEGFSALHVARRNEELHSGGTPFDSQKTSEWLPAFYETCQVLVESLDKKLETLLGTAEARAAEQLIAAYRDESAKSVQKAIAAHAVVWKSKSAPEQVRLTQQADVWATRKEGHQVKCPACNNSALLHGDPIAEPIRKLGERTVIESQQHLPSGFECIACGLKITGLSQLSASGLGTPYKTTSTYDLADYYGYYDPASGYDEDNNEPL